MSTDAIGENFDYQLGPDTVLAPDLSIADERAPIDGNETYDSTPLRLVVQLWYGLSDLNQKR